MAGDPDQAPFTPPNPEPGGGRSRLGGVPSAGGPPKRRRTPPGRRHGIRKMQPERSPDADEWVSQRVPEREGTHEEAPASARAASYHLCVRGQRIGGTLFDTDLCDARSGDVGDGELVAGHTHEVALARRATERVPDQARECVAAL